MENKTEFRINFKKYREYCKTNGIQIPHWMNHIIFKRVIKFMVNGEKLQACKYLTTLSKELNTRKPGIGDSHKYDGYDFGLKWSKTEVVDVIESFRVVHECEAPTPGKPIVSMNTIKEVIRPFAEIGENYYGEHKFHHVSSDPNQVGIIAIKISDFRAIYYLYKTLNEHGKL